MRIRYWSSDVCASDLGQQDRAVVRCARVQRAWMQVQHPCLVLLDQRRGLEASSPCRLDLETVRNAPDHADSRRGGFAERVVVFVAQGAVENQSADQWNVLIFTNERKIHLAIRVAALVGPVVDHTSTWLDRVRKSTLAIDGNGRETCGAAGKRSQLAFPLQACRFTFVYVLILIQAGT